MFRHADVCVLCISMAVLNVAFCIACSLLMLVEDARGDHMEEAYCLIGSHEGLLLFTLSCFCECFYYS